MNNVLNDIETLAEMFYDWSEYAPEYFKDKHNLKADIKKAEEIVRKYGNNGLHSKFLETIDEANKLDFTEYVFNFEGKIYLVEWNGMKYGDPIEMLILGEKEKK